MTTDQPAESPVNTQLISEAQAARLVRVLLLGGTSLSLGLAGLIWALAQALP